MSGEFTGRKIIVFGASSGIGRQTAIQLSRLGARVILVSRNVERLNSVLGELDGSGHLVLPCDVSVFDAAQNAVKEAVKIDGVKLDGCVFSAGMYILNPVSIVKEKTLHEMFRTNFYALVAIMKSFASRRISNDGASFVSISSRAALAPDKAQGVYAATKAAMNAYVITAARELASRQIRVNTICPEVVDSPMGAGFKETSQPEKIQNLYPLGLIQTQDVADTVLFLLGDKSKKITGQSIWLSAGNDGGSVDVYDL